MERQKVLMRVGFSMFQAFAYKRVCVGRHSHTLKHTNYKKIIFSALAQSITQAYTLGKCTSNRWVLFVQLISWLVKHKFSFAYQKATIKGFPHWSLKWIHCTAMWMCDSHWSDKRCIHMRRFSFLLYSCYVMNLNQAENLFLLWK